MSTYSAGQLNVTNLTATGTAAALNAISATVTNLTATNVSATNLTFEFENLNVETLNVQNQPVALAANGWNHLPTKTLPNTMRIVLQSCENTAGDIVSRKMKSVLNQNLITWPTSASGAAIVINSTTSFDQAMHEQMCGYVASLNPDTFIHTGDSGYCDAVNAAGMDTLLFTNYSESFDALPPGIQTLIGYTDSSGNSGPYFKAMAERSRDNNSEIWIQSDGGQKIRSTVEPRGGFHVVWDDHDVGSNNMAGIPENGEYQGRQFYKNKLNGWGAKNIVDGYDASNNELTIATKLDASGNPRHYWNGDIYNPRSTSLVPPSAALVSTIYRSWDQQLDYNDGTNNKFNIRFIVMDDQHYDSTTGNTFVQDIHNPSGFSPIFYPDLPKLNNPTSLPYWPSDGSENRVNTDFPNLSEFAAPRFSDSSNNKFEYFADPRYTETRNFFGDKQLDWAFGKILGASSFDLIVIVTGSPLWIESYGQDTLSIYPYERKKIANFIREHKVDNLIFTSGDTHFNYVSQKLNVAGYPIYDIVSSGVSQGVPTTFQDGPLRDCVWGPDWNQPGYKDPATGSIWKETPLGLGPSLGVKNVAPYNNANMYQFMTMDIILPNSVDSVNGDRFVNSTGSPITTPTIRLTQHYAQNIGVLSALSQPASVAMGPINAATGLINGVGPWRASDNVYDIDLRTLKHSYWKNVSTPTHFDASGSPYSYWKTNPCTDQLVKDASGNNGNSPLSDPMIPWNLGVPTQASSSPLVDISGNYLRDSSNNFLQIPMDIYCEILSAKQDSAGLFLDSSNNVITATCYIPQYTDKVNRNNFIVFDSSNSAYAALNSDLSGYGFDQICKFDSSYNPYTPSNQTFTASGNVYYLAYDSSGVKTNHVTSPYYYIYGSPSVEYSPNGLVLRYGKAAYGVMQVGNVYNNLPANPMCPYVEEITVNPNLNTFMASGYLANAAFGAITVSAATGILTQYYANMAANVFNYPLDCYPTFNRKYFVTVTRDPSGANVTSEKTRTFQLPLNMQNINANYHGALLTNKDVELFGKTSAPFPYTFGFSPDLVAVKNDVTTAFGPWTKKTDITSNNGYGDLRWLDNYGLQQYDKTAAAICGAAGYVGETPTFTFYSTDPSGNDYKYIQTVNNYKLKYKNNTIFTNVPGSTGYNFGSYSDGFYMNSLEAQIGTAPTIFHELFYQQFQNVMRRMCYGTENLGRNMVTWPGVKVCNSVGIDAVDSAGSYTVIFTDSSNVVNWDIAIDVSGNPMNIDASNNSVVINALASIASPLLPNGSGVPILKYYTDNVTTDPNYVLITTSGSSSGYTDVKVPANTLQQFSQVRYTNIGTSTKMTNLWYENNKFINALYTSPANMGANTATPNFQVFTDPSGFTGKSTMYPLAPNQVSGTQTTVYPAAISALYADRGVGMYASQAYTGTSSSSSMPRSIFDIYRAFNSSYFANWPNAFVGNGGNGQKINSQVVCSTPKATPN